MALERQHRRGRHAGKAEFQTARPATTYVRTLKGFRTSREGLAQAKPALAHAEFADSALGEIAERVAAEEPCEAFLAPAAAPQQLGQARQVGGVAQAARQ